MSHFLRQINDQTLVYLDRDYYQYVGEIYSIDLINWGCRLAGEEEGTQGIGTQEEAIAFLLWWHEDDRNHWKKEFRL